MYGENIKCYEVNSARNKQRQQTQDNIRNPTFWCHLPLFWCIVFTSQSNRFTKNDGDESFQLVVLSCVASSKRWLLLLLCCRCCCCVIVRVIVHRFIIVELSCAVYWVTPWRDCGHALMWGFWPQPLLLFCTLETGPASCAYNTTHKCSVRATDSEEVV